MPCYHPIPAFKPTDGGAISFVEKRRSSRDAGAFMERGFREIRIPCGQCIGCRLKRQNAWAIRAMCESQLHEQNWFPTFTYSDEHLPLHGSLKYSDIQSCFNRLRSSHGPFRYFVAGEYGDKFGRCHWHALMFGLRLDDLEVLKTSKGQPIYRSPRLEKAWGKGHVFVGTVTTQSARYCASYTVKKITGARAEDHYSRVVGETGEIIRLQPEMARMSRRPGLGADWLKRYWPEVVTHDGVVSGGRVHPTPRYFSERLQSVLEDDAVASDVESLLELKRVAAGERIAADVTRERLAVREQCALARVAFHAERLR